MISVYILAPRRKFAFFSTAPRGAIQIVYPLFPQNQIARGAEFLSRKFKVHSLSPYYGALMSNDELIVSADEWCGRSLRVPQAAASVLSSLRGPMESEGTAVVLVGGLLTKSGLPTLLQIFRGQLFIRALDDKALVGTSLNPGAVGSQPYPPVTDVIARTEGSGSPQIPLEWMELTPLQRTPLTAELSVRIRWNSDAQMTPAHGFHISLFGHNERVFFTKYPNWDQLPADLNQLEVPVSVPVNHRGLYTVFVEIVITLPGRLAVEQAVSNALMDVFVV